MIRSLFSNLGSQFALFRQYRRKKHQKKSGKKNREYWIRLRYVVYMGAFGFASFGVFAIGAFLRGYNTLGSILGVVAISAPFLGSVLFDIIEFFSEHSFGHILWPSGGETAPAHSVGESLVYNEQYEEAINWFTNLAMSDPSDWRAQWRIVEILEEFLDDPERLAEERNRLLKTEGVPEGLWIQTAMNLGEEWKKLGHQDRAINTYKGLLWRMPEGPDADEVRRRLAELKVL